MIESLIAALLLTLLVAGGVLFVRSARRRRLIAQRLAPAVVVEEESAGVERLTQPVSAGALLGLHFPQESLPAALRWFGLPLRRAGTHLGAVDMILFMTFGALACGTAAHFLIRVPLWTFIIAGLGAYIPFGFTVVVAAIRTAKVEKQLADALDVVVGALQAGIGLRQALEIVRSEMRPPISVEFNEVLARMDLGVPPPEAFRIMARSLRSKYVDLFVTTVAAKWDVGGNLTEMLKGLSRRIRETIRLQRRVRSLTAEAKFSAIILFIMPYAMGLMIWISNPDSLIYLFNHPMGSVMVQGAIILQIVALFWIARILKFEH